MDLLDVDADNVDPVLGLFCFVLLPYVVLDHASDTGWHC